MNIGVQRPHVAFIVDPTHGHINPILGIASELVERRCRVTCAVKEYFASRVVDSGAEPVVYLPLDSRFRFAPKARECQGDIIALTKLWHEYEQEELDTALSQLEVLYRGDRPDLIVYDLRSLAGKTLASKWDIPKIEHSPQFIEPNGLNFLGRPYDEALVIASIPRAFQPHADELDERFHFVGPIYNSRTFFRPWRSDTSGALIILVSAITFEPQPEFFKTVIRALENLPYRVVLSIGDELDPGSLGPLAPHFQINQCSSHLEILKHASLLIYQGGLGSTLEAFYRGVPTLSIPPDQLYDQVAFRVAELGLGLRLEKSATIEELREAAAFLLQDRETKSRVKEMQRTIQDTNGAKLAGDLILGNLSLSGSGSS